MSLSSEFTIGCDLCDTVVTSEIKTIPCAWRTCWLNFGLEPGEKRWSSAEFIVCDKCLGDKGKPLFKRVWHQLTSVIP